MGGAGAGVSGRMGEQGGLRTGWLAAFGTEGYEGEPPLLEELGVNFGHIKGKVWMAFIFSFHIVARRLWLDGAAYPLCLLQTASVHPSSLSYFPEKKAKPTNTNNTALSRH